MGLIWGHVQTPTCGLSNLRTSIWSVWKRRDVFRLREKCTQVRVRSFHSSSSFHMRMFFSAASHNTAHTGWVFCLVFWWLTGVVVDSRESSSLLLNKNHCFPGSDSLCKETNSYDDWKQIFLIRYITKLQFWAYLNVTYLWSREASGLAGCIKGSSFNYERGGTTKVT